MPPSLLQNSYKIQSINHNRRVFFAWLLFVVLICILITRLFDLQCIQGREMFRMGQDNQLTLASITPQRGRIYDRNHKVLAENAAVFHLDLTPSEGHNPADTLAILSTIIPLSTDKQAHLVEQLTYRKSSPKPIRILNNLTTEQLDQVSLNKYRLPGVSIGSDYIRRYPCGAACASITGYVTQEKHSRHHPRQRIANPQVPLYSGVNGIEKNYDESLTGKQGVQQLHRTAQGKVVQQDITLPALQGDDITLSIDSRLQKLIAKRMGKLRGAVVMIDPNNGDVLALYSSPSYDPNAFLQDSKSFTPFFTDPDKPLFNRVVSGLFPPASTIKPFLILGALQDHTITQETSIFDPGYFRYGKTSYIYHNWLRSGHQNVRPYKAILLSNDTFFYHLSLMLGIDKISDILGNWGFGTRSYIDLPGEKNGLLPTREWKENLGKNWLVGDTIITGIGQGAMLSTPLQIAQAMAILANHGTGYQPHLLLSSHHPSGQTTPFEPTQLPPVNLKNSHYQHIVDAMAKVTTQGTGRRFGAFSWPVAAKTGTAQVARHSGKDKKYAKHLQDHSIFALFTPVKKPQVAMVVLLENNHSAILVARGIMDDYLSLQNT